MAAAIPENFITGQAPGITIERIDFAKTPLQAYTGLYATILDNVLSAEECHTLLRMAEAQTSGGWERAMVNIGNGKQAMYEDVRSCGRIIWDDMDVVARLWRRVAPLVPEIARLESQAYITGVGPAKRNEVWKLTRLNERMRFLKYQGGEYFRPHCDGCYETPDKNERSYFTLHLYLNDHGPPDEASLNLLPPEKREAARRSELRGGATTFHSYNMQEKLDVLPKTGRVLLFQHRGLLHSGDDVIRGVKYTMRTDIMYAIEKED